MAASKERGGFIHLTRLGRATLGVAVAIGLALYAVAPIGAQTTSASIFGQVKDSQGGVLPGATVTLTSRTQAYTLTATSDAEGRFVFPIVRPDLYALRASMQGFKTLERTNVQVSANDRFFTGILTLDMGAITEEVSVTGRVSDITYDAIANLTKIWGAHASKFGVYYQHSYKAQSNFSSFNGRVSFIDDTSNPYDTGYSYAVAQGGLEPGRRGGRQ